MAKKIVNPKLEQIKDEIEDAVAAIYERHGMMRSPHLTTRWISKNPSSTLWGIEQTEDGKIPQEAPAIKVEIKICQW